MSWQSPQTWNTATLADICNRIVDGSHNPPTGQPSGKPMLSAKNIQNGKIHFDELRLLSNDDFELENSRTNISAGDVLLTIVGAIGRTAVVPETAPEFTLQRSVAVLKTNFINPNYLRYLLDSPTAQSFFLNNAKGTAQKGIYLKALGGMQIPIAPPEEQARIAQKLDGLLAQVAPLKARIDGMPALLKRFRQSVLDAGVSGRLTEDWRRDQTGSESQYTADGLPLGWSIVPLGRYVVNHDGARKPISAKERESRRGNHPYFGATGQIDCIDGYTHDGEFVLVGEDGANLLTRVKPLAFTVNGQVWVNNHAHVIASPHGHSNAYLAIYLNTLDITQWVSGSAQPKLNQKNMNEIPIHVPLAIEQLEIVRRIEQLFAFASQLEAKVASAKSRIDHLVHSILAKAFRGELVPQDPNDEPASVLLERIRAQRAAAPKVRRGRKALT